MQQPVDTSGSPRPKHARLSATSNHPECAHTISHSKLQPAQSDAGSAPIGADHERAKPLERSKRVGGASNAVIAPHPVVQASLGLGPDLNRSVDVPTSSTLQMQLLNAMPAAPRRQCYDPSVVLRCWV